ncbi:hypothetical protein TNCV_1086781 [Trichonephila clavipes]|nr:hypothetical protein TNCV_1086781 [Trichonephila clavipes]
MHRIFQRLHRQFCETHSFRVNGHDYVRSPILEESIWSVIKSSTRAAIHHEKQVLPELLQDAPVATRNRMWYQHNWIPAHFSTDVQTYLNATFGFPCKNCGGGDRGGVAIYRLFGEFRRRAKIALSPVWCSRPTTGVPLAHATMNFVGLNLTTSDRGACIEMKESARNPSSCVMRRQCHRTSGNISPDLGTDGSYRGTEQHVLILPIRAVKQTLLSVETDYIYVF